MAHVRRTCEALIGVATVPRFLMAAHLAEGRLVQLLPDLPVPSTQATALFSKTNVRSPTPRTVIDALSGPR